MVVPGHFHSKLLYAMWQSVLDDGCCEPSSTLLHEVRICWKQPAGSLLGLSLGVLHLHGWSGKGTHALHGVSSGRTCHPTPICLSLMPLSKVYVFFSSFACLLLNVFLGVLLFLLFL